MSAPRVVLIGPMGAGKSTVGGLLARAWGTELRDTDRDIEAAQGRSVSDIFVDDGEDHFRELERDAVAAALGEHTGVLSLGGGAVLDVDQSGQDRRPGKQNDRSPQPAAGRSGGGPLDVCRLGHALARPSSCQWSLVVRPRMVTRAAARECRGLLHMIGRARRVPAAGACGETGKPGPGGPRTLFCCAERQ